MKKLSLCLLLGVFFVPLFAQEQQSGMPGDNLNLYAVLDIFQKSPTLEEFEKTLNEQDSKVNNLDLNGDGQIDYIHVIDNANGANHDIALRVDINQTESQDVAVIEVEKDAANHVHVQIVGDEALYGKDYIVEPNQSTQNPGYQGDVAPTTVYYAPDSWAISGFLFAPYYVPWFSPFHWGYYPHYWHPWGPLSYSAYYGYHNHGYYNYRRSNVYYSPAAHNYYSGHRQSSVIVRDRYHNQPNHNPPHPQPHQQPGYQQPGHQQPHQQPGREQPHQQPGNQQPRQQPGNQQPHQQPGNQQPHQQPGHQQQGHQQQGHQQQGHQQQGHQQPHQKTNGDQHRK